MIKKKPYIVLAGFQYSFSFLEISRSHGYAILGAYNIKSRFSGNYNDSYSILLFQKTTYYKTMLNF